VIGDLVESHHDFAIRRVPTNLQDQLRWARTLQQFGRDADVLCEACATLIRRMHGPHDLLA
jgi:hypothetical protein